MRVRRLAAAGTATLLLPFTACSDGDSNAEPVEPTNSTAPSPSETAHEGPTLPPEAQGDGQAAAKAFVKFYFALISDAMVTGDTAPLRSYSTQRCGSCKNLAQKIDRLHRKNARLETEGWVPQKYVPEQLTSTSYAVYLSVKAHPQRLYDDTGRLVDRDPAEIIPMRVVSVRRDGEWRLDWLENLQ